MSIVLEYKGLGKEYKFGLFKNKRVKAVENLDLQVRQGEIFGFLGPNGAGKTTTIKMTMGFLKPTGGTIKVLGEHTHNWWVRERVGFLPENPSIYPYLTGRQALFMIGKMFSMDSASIKRRVSELSEELGLRMELTLPIRKHSKGMLQRVSLAQALINDPDLVVLDEPMSGLDPIGRKMFRDTIMRLKAAGKTVFLSSHILSDIEMLCDRIGILAHGRLVMEATMADVEKIKQQAGQSLEQIFMEKVGAAQ